MCGAIEVQECVCACACVRACVYVLARVCFYLCICACEHVCVHACMCVGVVGDCACPGNPTRSYNAPGVFYL